MRCRRLPQYNLVRGELGNLLSWERRNCPKQPRLTTWRSTRDGSKLITTTSETRTLGQRTLVGFCTGMAQLRVTPASWGWCSGRPIRAGRDRTKEAEHLEREGATSYEVLEAISMTPSTKPRS
jgi:hypothetical protein